MHIKFLAHGTGDPYRAIEYLLATHDYKGQRRPVVTVLRGDPFQVAAVADSLSFVHRYTSWVIAWPQEDAPTPEEVDAVMDWFERIAFAGLSLDRVSRAVIWHGDHAHVMSARVDLLTGKSFNLAPPRWKGAFYPLRDYWNGIKGWARPQDIQRARFLSMPPPRPFPNIAKKVLEHTDLGFALSDIETALNVEPDTEFLITDWLLEGIHDRKIHSYTDVLKALQSEGTVIKTFTTSLHYLVDGSQKPIVLAGRLFSRNFNVQEVLDRASIQETLQAGRSNPDLAFAAAAYQRMMAVIAYRTADNRRNFTPQVEVKPHIKSGAGSATNRKQVRLGPLAKVSNASNSIMGPARRALAQAQMAISRCAEVCMATLQKMTEIVSPESSRDQIAMERAIEAKNAINKLDLTLSGPGPIPHKP